MRYFAADGSELLERKDRVWKEPAVVERTVAALRAAKRELPGYVDVLVAETTGGPTKTALFSMY